MGDRKEYMKQYHKDNRARIKEQHKQWYKDNSDRIKERSKQYRKDNYDRIKEYQKQWYKDHREQRKQYRKDNRDHIKEYHKQHRKDNYARIREQEKQWYMNHPEYAKQYYREHRERIRERYKQYLKDHREYAKQYRKDHREQRKQYHKDHREQRNYYQRNRLKTDLKFKLSRNIDRAIRESLKGNKGGRHWENLVGYTLEDLVKRLKRTMLAGYNWRDYSKGKLHLDHKIPIGAFNYTKPEHIDFKKCWALNNLRLLPAEENLKKGDKLERPFQAALTISI